MFSQFRQCYPQGSLISELITIDCGQYIVRVSVQVEGITLATGLGAARIIEEAEDKARQRALDTLDLTPKMVKVTSSTPTVEVTSPPPSQPISESSSIPPVSPSKPPTVEETSSLSEPSVREIPQEKPKKSAKSTKKAKNSITSTPSTITPPEKETPVIPSEATPEKEEVSLPSEFPDISTTQEPIAEEEPLLSLEDTPSEPEPTPEPDITSEISETPEEPQPSLDLGESMDFSDIIAQSNAELKRLRWTQEEGRDYLIRTYGKRSRQLLSDEELIEFLHYLQGLPTPPKD